MSSIVFSSVLRSPTWIIFAAVMFSALQGCSKGNEYVPPPALDVTVSRPQQQTVTDYAEFNGVTEAVESVEIRARVEGYLESLHFQSGGQVKKGDLLFVIDPKPFQAKLDEARAELERRQAELKQAEATLQRKELAYKANAVSEVEVIQGRADRDVAKAAIQAAQATIETARLNLSYTKIHAPLNGRIGRNMVDAGNLVGATERTLLTTLVRDDPIYVYFNVSERDLLRYRESNNLQESPANGNGDIKVYLGLADQQGYPFEGHVDFVDNRLDPNTGTIQVRGLFANADHVLRPGLFARIRVPVGNREAALLLPDTAVGSDQRGDYVLVVNEKNVVEYRPVKTGSLVNDLRVIEGGIAPADRIVVNGLQRARAGLEVKPVEGEETR